MHFQIDPSGTDYTRVHIDVANDQLGEIIRAITSTQAEKDEARAARQAAHRAARFRRAAAPQAAEDETPAPSPAFSSWPIKRVASVRASSGDRELVGTVVDYVPATVTGSTGRVVFKEQADQEAIADEDACRSVDAEDDAELDCEGPGAEGVDGGEDR